MTDEYRCSLCWATFTTAAHLAQHEAMERTIRYDLSDADHEPSTKAESK